MIDSSRHFLPLPAIKRMVDAMAWVKLNVLHWHLVDDEAFPMQFLSQPTLWEGRLLAPGALHEGRSLFSLSLRSISRRWWRTRARGESTWFRSSTCRVTRPRGASAVRVRG